MFRPPIQCTCIVSINTAVVLLAFTLFSYFTVLQFNWCQVRGGDSLLSRERGSSRRFGERRSEVLIFIALCPKSAHMKGFIGSRTWPRPEQYTMYLPKHSRETWDRDGLGRLAQTRIEGLFFENPSCTFFLSYAAC